MFRNREIISLGILESDIYPVFNVFPLRSCLRALLPPTSPYYKPFSAPRPTGDLTLEGDQGPSLGDLTSGLDMFYADSCGMSRSQQLMGVVLCQVASSRTTMSRT